MSWRKNLRKAKLGNAEFHVDTSGGSLGRNTQVHEYPQRDTPYVEDLGRKARRFTLECYVLASDYSTDKDAGDYMPARDALIAEIESAGSKTLVHPYLGELKVTVVDCDGPRETTREGGMARFTLTFVESGEHVFPSGNVSTTRAAAVAADEALVAIYTACSKKFSVANKPDHLVTSATSMVRKWATDLQTFVTRVTTLPSALTDFMADLSALSGAIAQLILVPQTLASNMGSLFAQFEHIAARPVDALNLTRSLFTWGDDLAVPPDNGSATRDELVTNQEAFVALIQQAALLTAVQVATTIDYDSADAALTMRDELVALFDDQADAATTDELYFALVDARTAFANDMQVRAAQLDKLMTVSLPETMPALVMAYQLYGSVDRAEDIVARNNARDPLALPSGVALQVLSNG